MKKLLLFVVALILISDLSAQVERLIPFSEKKKERIAEIAKMLPAKPQGFGVPLTDEKAWDKVRANADVKKIIESADAIVAKPMPPFVEELYTDFQRSQDRIPGERMMGARTQRLKPLVWAECIENKGRYVKAIEQTLMELVNMPSWTIPVHDSKLTNLRGTEYTVDLGSSLLAQTFAQTLYFLGDKISPGVRAAVISQMYRKVFDTEYNTIETGTGGNWHLFTTNNWNAVCLSGVAGAALAIIEDVNMRAYYAAACEYYSRNSLEGFTDDGYCSEGMGYFNYGFSHYITLREILYQNTNGKLDLFNDPKFQRIAQYGTNMEMTPGIYPSIADCGLGARPSSDISYYCGMVFGMPNPRAWTVHKTCPDFNFGLMKQFENSTSKPIAKTSTSTDRHHSYFNIAGVLISRPEDGAAPLSVAMKGGHNDEHHNHNDVGTYLVVLGDKLISGEPGGSHPYYADMFDNNLRYTKYKTQSSWGHPVPVYAGENQMYGRECEGKVLKTNFTPSKDEFVIDIKSAYPNSKDLQKAVRSFTYNRAKEGTFVVCDEFAFASPQNMETALITLGDWEQVDKNTLKIKNGGKTLYAHIEANGGEVEVIGGQWKENTPLIKRVAVRFKDKVTNGSITVTYSTKA